MYRLREIYDKFNKLIVFVTACISISTVSLFIIGLRVEVKKTRSDIDKTRGELYGHIRQSDSTLHRLLIQAIILRKDIEKSQREAEMQNKHLKELIKMRK